MGSDLLPSVDIYGEREIYILSIFQQTTESIFNTIWLMCSQ